MPLAFPMAEILRLFPVLRNVSFRYPGLDDFVLRDVSFKIEKGQLCVSPIFLVLAFGACLTLERQVIVGTNGSGKSTVLKLMLRLYDPTVGTILVNGQDIKTFKLADLRESMAVLFQDHTHFPLTVSHPARNAALRIGR